MGSVIKNLPANAGDIGSIPGLGRSHMPHSNWVRVPQLLRCMLQLPKPTHPRACALQQREATAMRSQCPATRVGPACHN